MNPHKVDAIGLLSVVMALAAAYFGLFRGGIREQADLDRQAKQLEERATERELLQAEADRAQKLLDPLRKTAQGALAALAKPGDGDQFLQQLATLAREAAIDIRLLRPGTRVKDGTCHYIPIQLTAAASFPQIHQFLARLERIEQLATVEQLSITSEVKKANCEAMLTLRLHLPSSEKPL